MRFSKCFASGLVFTSSFGAGVAGRSTSGSMIRRDAAFRRAREHGHVHVAGALGLVEQPLLARDEEHVRVAVHEARFVGPDRHARGAVEVREEAARGRRVRVREAGRDVERGRADEVFAQVVALVARHAGHLG